MPKRDAVAELATKVVQTLEQRREQGGAHDFLSRSQLVALLDPPPTPELLTKALAKKPFAAQIVVAVAKHPESPIALADELDRLAASPLLLEFALGLLCAETSPLHTLAQLLAKLAKPLRPAFKAAVERRVVEQTLPEGVGSVKAGKKTLLFLKKYPPPPPPEVALSAKMVQVLEARHGVGEGAYPVSLSQLIALADPKAKPTIRKRAIAREPFISAAIVAMPGRPDSPVALTVDRERLADHPLLLETALSAVLNRDNEAATLADLKKKVNKCLQTLLETAVRTRLDGGSLPSKVGCLRIKKKPYLFLRQDVFESVPSAPKTTTAPSPPLPPVDFARLFDEAFDRLDRQRGAHNLVSLVDLRLALPLERAAFDAGLQQLRRDGRYSLSAAEGRQGLRLEERDAGVVEEGTLLLFVSRRVMSTGRTPS